jgi:autotransporter passenger strand-loop-strand repeat protein
MPSATISGFTIGDIIDLASVASGSGGSAVLTSGNVLDVVEGGSTYVLNLNPSQNFSGTQFVLSSDGISGTDITLANLVSVPSGWTLTVSSGQTSGGVVVLSGGTLDILSGGTAVGTSVNSGGSEIVSSGGTASNTVVSSGGSLRRRHGSVGANLRRYPDGAVGRRRERRHDLLRLAGRLIRRHRERRSDQWRLGRN